MCHHRRRAADALCAVILPRRQPTQAFAPQPSSPRNSLKRPTPLKIHQLTIVLRPVEDDLRKVDPVGGGWLKDAELISLRSARTCQTQPLSLIGVSVSCGAPTAQRRCTSSSRLRVLRSRCRQFLPPLPPILAGVAPQGRGRTCSAGSGRASRCVRPSSNPVLRSRSQRGGRGPRNRGRGLARSAGRPAWPQQPFIPGEAAWLDEHMMRFLGTLEISAIGPRG